MRGIEIGLSSSAFQLDWKYFSKVNNVFLFDILTIYPLPPKPKIVRKIC
jgi:hypothetical protein